MKKKLVLLCVSSLKNKARNTIYANAYLDVQDQDIHGRQVGPISDLIFNELFDYSHFSSSKMYKIKKDFIVTWKTIKALAAKHEILAE